MKQCNAFEEGRPTEDKGRAASSSFSPKNAMLSVRYQRKPVRQFRQFQIERIKREIGCVMKESPVNSKRTFEAFANCPRNSQKRGRTFRTSYTRTVGSLSASLLFLF